MINLTNEARSKNMSAIRSKNTKPELAVRRILFKLGYRYRLHKKLLPGHPDIYIKKNRTAIFVHGCFWHQHEDCKRNFMPKSNVEYWKKKLKGNVERFIKIRSVLQKNNYKILVIWECEAKNELKLSKKLFNLRQLEYSLSNKFIPRTE